ncbi:hypothetical protein NDU88_007172 [Pleurodeles waltl]|uniref:Uncharacterized protein n=1 Tax=Pleurodeles waltl TaxID=8319 RepID=A0AAV7RSD5_PLEWA|nr:hypothetical protein NDU88_007172 [Pleurodeles waltl]
MPTRCPIRGATHFRSHRRSQARGATSWLLMSSSLPLVSSAGRSPPGRQLCRLPCFLFGLGHPGGRFYLSAMVISPVRSPVSPARRDRRLIHAPGGGELLSFISASYSPVMAPRGPQPPGPTAVRTVPRAVRLILLAQQPAPLQPRGTVFNAPTGAPAARSPTGPSTTQGRAHSEASSRS